MFQQLKETFLFSSCLTPSPLSHYLPQTCIRIEGFLPSYLTESSEPKNKIRRQEPTILTAKDTLATRSLLRQEPLLSSASSLASSSSLLHSSELLLSARFQKICKISHDCRESSISMEKSKDFIVNGECKIMRLTTRS